MGLFESGIVQVSSAIGTAPSLCWNPENTSTTTFGAYGSVASTAVLKDVTIVNSGTQTVIVGSGTQSGLCLGLQLAPGQQLTIQGYSVTSPSGTVGQIWAVANTGTGATTAGMASVASVV